jgi:transcriptional regulator with XRE-family HTH domain
MTNQVWLPADGALLKKLREDAGVEITTLARLHSLSSSQVKQLENGGDSSFYTPAIKLATGRKLLMHFGADVNPIEQAPEQYHPQELESPAEEVNTEQVKNVSLKETNILLRPQIVVVSLVLSCLVYWSFFKSAPVGEKEMLTTSKPVSIALPTESINAETKPIASTLPTPADTRKESSPECIWGNDSVPVFGYQPTKSGDYVHVVANSDASICVRDATGKVQILHLKNSQSQTIRGRQPFELFSSNLNEFKLFYQGNLLRLPSSNIKNITLKEQKYE